MATVTITLDDDLRERLEGLARSVDRSLDELAADAIEAYLDIDDLELDDRQIEQVEQAISQADAGGPFIPHE